MGIKKHTINIEEYVTGGAKCSNPKIIWDTPICGAIRCEKKNGFIINVTVPDGCDECFYGTYFCNDYCTDCDPVRIKVCPCETNADCGACAECHPIYKVCISKCKDNEFCTDHDTCVECNEEVPCTNGKQCVGGKCQCPPDKPYTNSNGDCTPCTDESCPPGQVCTPNGCEDPVCPSGVWHPVKKRCVECINTGDCPPGECCNGNNECDCCPGFVRDPITKVCVKAPCIEDGDCPKCFTCKTGVGCVPQICPDGQICIDGDCVDECNCTNPNCIKPGDACVALNSETCYCKPCSGSCANGQPCGEGCFCDPVDLQCKPNPCANVPCTDGSECGKGCGCNKETHRCEPCSSADCGTECDNLLGCTCPDGVNCMDVPGCDQPCYGFGDCPPGCACDGGRCKPCADFDCDTNDCSSHPECRCNGAKCEGDPDFCKDTFVKEDFDCGVEAQLTLNDGCMCPGITAYVTPHIISKGLTQVGSSEITHLVSVAMRLAKGVAETWEEVKNLHLLDETQYEDIADNDTPLSGSLDLTITEFYQPQVWVSGAWINQGAVASRELPVSGSYSFAGIARKENIRFNATKIGTGKNIVTGVSQEKIVRYEVAVKANSLTFANNCVYTAKTLPTIKLDATNYKPVTDSLDQLSGQFSYIDLFIGAPNGNYNLGGKFVKMANIRSDSKRNPLFTWFRSEDDVYTKEDIIRKLYITPDVANGKIYTDTLFGPKAFDLKKQNLMSPEGRVFGDMYYKVITDCGCGEKSLDFGNMKWCSPDSLALGNIVFTQCNKKIEIKSDIGTPCPTNWDLNAFVLHPNDNTTAFKARHQAKYHLMIELEDGQKFDIAYIYKEVGGIQGLYSQTDNTPIRTFTKTYTSAITALRLELRYGSSTEVVCDWVKDIPAPANFTPTYTTTCLPNGKIQYRFPTVQNHISNITAVGGQVKVGLTYRDVVANVGQEVTAHITFTDYCPITMTLNGNCCDTLAIDIQRVDSPVAGVTDLTATITGGSAPFSVSYYRQVDGTHELVGESSNSATNYKLSLINPTPGLYIGEVTDANGCVQDSPVISIDPRDAGDYPVTIAPKFSGCAYTGNVGITIPQQTDVVGGKIFYRVDEGSDQSFTITQSMYNAGEHLLPATGHTIHLIRLEVNNSAGPATVFPLSGSASVPTNLNEAIPVVTSFTLNGVQPTITICGGQDVLIELQGSANAIVQIDGIAPINLDGSGYGASLQTPTASRVYTITGITNSNGQCTGNQGVGQARQVTVLTVPAIDIVSDECDGTRSFRTVTFNNITSATDQNGNSLLITSSSVTVEIGVVTEIHATYTVGGCSATLVHTILACGAVEITGTVTGPNVVCLGESATITVSGVTGGTAPYYYNYYTNTNFNDIYTLNETSKTFLFAATDTVYVRVKDANGNIAAIGSKTVTVAAAPVPNIIDAGINTAGVEEVSDNVFEIGDNLDTVVFKTQLNYTTYGWLVTGSYGGATTGSNSTFSIDVSEISGEITLQVTVTTPDGCTGTETVTITTVTGEEILESDELLFTTSSYKLYKVAVSPAAIDIPVMLCGAGNPAVSVAMRGNGDLITANNNDLYKINVLSGCGATLLGQVNHSNSLGMLTADKVVSFKTDKLSTYDLLTNTADNAFYTISDAPNSYIPTGDLQRIGSDLYGLARQYVSGVGGNKVLVKFALNGSNAVTSFTNVGALPNQGGNPYGLAYVGGVAYLVFSDGKVYNLNLATPSSSTLIGTIVVPGGEPIFDVTNNF